MVAFLLTYLAVSAPTTALAAAPSNDNFASRQVLSGPLPIEVSGTNVEATKESGESLGGLYPAGHSVWFEWQAPSSGFVTIGSCVVPFSNLVGIYQGGSVTSLVKVASGNSSEGPSCPASEREWTFRAAAGETYEIAVDGNSFSAPGEAPPLTEGEFSLRIEATPPPANDDFADAETIEGETGEEPDGERYYLADFRGYNWGATDEPGEFKFGSGPVSSVWYRWIPPQTGTYNLNGPCCGSRLRGALFAGGSFGEENEMLPATGSAKVSLVGGKEYWIDVYGLLENGMPEPQVGSFSFLITASLPPLPPPPSPGGGATGPSPPDKTPPETTIHEHVLKRRPPIFVFGFAATEPGSAFRCKLDGHPLVTCSSPRIYGHLKPGPHTFAVAAVDPAGNEDLTPAVARFKFPERPQHRREHRRAGD